MIRLPRTKAHRHAEATTRGTFAHPCDDGSPASDAAGGARDAPVANTGAHGAPVPHAPQDPDLADIAASLASVAAQLASLAQQLAGQLGSAAGSSPNRLALLASPEAVMATTMPATDAKLTLTQAETATLLGVHPRTLQRLRAAGEGPRPITIGRAVRYRRADLLRWLEGKRP